MFVLVEQYSYLENDCEGKKRTIFFDNQFEINYTNKIDVYFFAEQKQTNGPMFFPGNQGIERCLVLLSRSGLFCVCFVSR